MRIAYQRSTLQLACNHSASVSLTSKCGEVKGRSSPGDAQSEAEDTSGAPGRGEGQVSGTSSVTRLVGGHFKVSSGWGAGKELPPPEDWGSSGQKGEQRHTSAFL